MHRSFRFVLTLVSGWTLAATVSADDAKPRPMNIDDLWAIQRLGRPALSPDGQWVAVEVTTYDMAKNEPTSDIWLLSTDGKTQRQLTHHAARDSEPTWSPDGKQIAFVSKRGDTPQIYLISPDGGEARQLTKMPMAPSGPKWVADGKTLCCIARTWSDTTDDASYEKREKEMKDSKVQAYIIDDAMFRVWDNWIADGKRPVVFALDVASGQHRNLFTHTKLHLPIYQPSASDYDISPDGKEIAFTADSVKEIGTDFNSDIYVMPLDKAGEPRNLTADNPAGDSSPAYSPDGKSLAFLRQAIKYFYADRARLMLLDRISGKSQELTAQFDRTCSAPTWSPDSQRLYFDAEDKAYVRLFSVSTKGNDVTPLTAGYTDRGFELSADGKTIAFGRSSFDFPTRIYALSLGSQPQRIDRFNDGISSKWKLGEVKDVYFKGADNEDVQMWIVYPPDFDPKKKWPLLQVVHGGPHNGITTDFSFRWNLHMFASKGYVVSCINFHGSSGFGQAFTDSITGDVGAKPLVDVMKGTDYMLAQPYIDKERIAAAGGSYGGYMMAWINGHTDRFKAMICHAGVYNWHSMMASDFVRSRERPLGALPWGGDLAKIDKQSPQRLASNFKTPTLVIHGEKDYRVPVTQGFEYYNTLRQKGVPTRLIYFPDENHWILKPQNSRLWHLEFFAWLDKYIGNGPTK